jgi:hypothetical protein
MELVDPEGRAIALDRADPRYSLMLSSSACTFVADRQVAASIGFPAREFFRRGSEDIVFVHTLLNEFRIAQIGSVAVRVSVKASGHTARFLQRAAGAELAPPDQSALRQVNEAVALESAERRSGIEALVRRRDPKR